MDFMDERPTRIGPCSLLLIGAFDSMDSLLEKPCTSDVPRKPSMRLFLLLSVAMFRFKDVEEIFRNMLADRSTTIE
jgi:hypothetical protein